jgi:hypothetical protein
MDLVLQVQLLVLEYQLGVFFPGFDEKPLEFAARGPLDPKQGAAIAALDQAPFIRDVLAAAALRASESGYLHRWVDDANGVPGSPL